MGLVKVINGPYTWPKVNGFYLIGVITYNSIYTDPRGAQLVVISSKNPSSNVHTVDGSEIRNNHLGWC